MLLGRARADVGDVTAELAEMKRGRAILGRTLDSQNPKYLTAEIANSHVLDATGAHVDAANKNNRGATVEGRTQPSV
jgi:hypothetical protein